MGIDYRPVVVEQHGQLKWNQLLVDGNDLFELILPSAGIVGVTIHWILADKGASWSASFLEKTEQSYGKLKSKRISKLQPTG
jgi:hypothetical protein